MKKLLTIMVLGLFIISCDSQEKREAIEDCGEDPSVLNAKTNAAAKLAFKSCMIGMGF